ncbi:H-type small acid-soluble spore protein [Sediminibacillus dalangtanensis]|uniref:Small, acid-soluble spore protein H n=1 Tax=Sediminibacillus dalangtanensis TaxID=2729421 RepID=A0ABX7VR67_9BACI|nr:H-type small acid-soluble spore protein [Sediminibacillus dalangtanensis]QTM99003.1 H-type small acid-soluble spore protein [Sediminibacillus dalangtanensis]
MDAHRAQEITSSDAMIDVTYNGGKVYIEHVDQGAGMATVHPLDNPETKQSVQVEDLLEQ